MPPAASLFWAAAPVGCCPFIDKLPSPAGPRAVGFADLAYGIAGVIAASFSPDYWFAVILISSIFRVGCGIGHIRSIIRDKNYAINNTAILFVNFVVPAFLIFAYLTWAR